MRAIIVRLLEDKRREKVLLPDWADVPAPKGNQFKSRTLFSGVTNGTERNDLTRGNYAHKDEKLPAGWGYQNVGEIIEIGADVKRLKVGDVVYMSADHTEFVLFAEDGLLVKIPPEVDPTHAALFGMAAVAMRTCRNAELLMGNKLLVVGMGCIGQFAAQIANVMGARVDVCDIDSQRLELAEKIGAVEKVFDVSGDGWEKCIKDFTYDAVIDLAGVVGMEDKLINAAKGRGTVMFIAGRGKVSYTFNDGQGHEIVIKQNSHFDNADLANLCRLVARGMVKVQPIIRDVVPAEEAKGIYDKLRDVPNELLGTVFEW